MSDLNPRTDPDVVIIAKGQRRHRSLLSQAYMRMEILIMSCIRSMTTTTHAPGADRRKVVLTWERDRSRSKRHQHQGVSVAAPLTSSAGPQRCRMVVIS
jgi:hypothetical protein